MKVTELASGQQFHLTPKGPAHVFLRIAGECQTANRNQWGRATGGFYTANRVAMKENRLHRGMWFKYVAFRKDATVWVED